MVQPSNKLSWDELMYSASQESKMIESNIAINTETNHDESIAQQM